MAELVWSLNGKYFKDFGVGISSSDGILGELKPKKQDTKDWSEYNGVALDLTKKPKYEAREFTLSGWIVGADWLTMLNNFNALFGEFRNAGKQRLLLDVFGQKTLVFDVRCDDEIELKKTFKQGKMVGMFSLKLIEHNPIKKILYTDKTNLQLSFNSPKWVEVNIDGKIDVYKGTVNINKTLTNRVVTGYNFNGRNLLKNSTFKNDTQSWGINLNPYYDFRDNGIFLETNSVNTGIYQIISNNYEGAITVSFEVNFEIYEPIQNLIDFGVEDVFIKSLGYNDVKYREWVKVTAIFPISKIGNIAFHIFSQTNNRTSYTVRNIKLEKGNKATDWTPAPEDQHFISIAGNVDEITGLTTNADVLWEKL